jgi:hypothetical protein
MATPGAGGFVMSDQSILQDLTVKEWCRRRRVSVASYYAWAAEGKAPRSYKAGRIRRITPEADRDWLAEREAEEAARRGGR